MPVVSSWGLSDHVLAVFKARWDGRMATARVLASELRRPLADVLKMAHALHLPNAVQAQGDQGGEAGENDFLARPDPALRAMVRRDVAELAAEGRATIPEAWRDEGEGRGAMAQPERREAASDEAGKGKTKFCARCGKEKPIEAFHATRNAHDGRMRMCGACYGKPEVQAAPTSLDRFTPRPGAEQPPAERAHLREPADGVVQYPNRVREGVREGEGVQRVREVAGEPGVQLVGDEPTLSDELRSALISKVRVLVREVVEEMVRGEVERVLEAARAETDVRVRRLVRRSFAEVLADL